MSRQPTLCEFNGECLTNEDWCNEEIKKRSDMDDNVG